MITRLHFERVSIRGIRNLHPTELTFAPSLNVFVGGNGQGKTSLLEALCIAATGRSFRTEQLGEVVQSGAADFLVHATLNDEGLCREQHVTYAANRRQVAIDKKRIAKIADYATRTPIVVFGPGDLDLVTGAAATRRNLLDRIAIYTDPAAQDSRLAYARALKHRQHLLDRFDDNQPALVAFEALIVEHGLRYARAHRQAAEALSQFLVQSFGALCKNALDLTTTFAGLSLDDAETYRRELVNRRASDRQRGRATLGPHKDDLQLSLLGRSARHHASQGQQRLLALALKLSELRCIEAARQTRPILLLDDVASELDQSRSGSVFEWLHHTPSQVFLSTPRPDLLQTTEFASIDQMKFDVSGGQIRAGE